LATVGYLTVNAQKRKEKRNIDNLDFPFQRQQEGGEKDRLEGNIGINFFFQDEKGDATGKAVGPAFFIDQASLQRKKKKGEA